MGAASDLRRLSRIIKGAVPIAAEVKNRGPGICLSIGVDHIVVELPLNIVFKAPPLLNTVKHCRQIDHETRPPGVVAGRINARISSHEAASMAAAGLIPPNLSTILRSLVADGISSARDLAAGVEAERFVVH